MFKRLTFCWNKAQEHGMGGMEYAQLESLIPLKDDHRLGDGMKLELVIRLSVGKMTSKFQKFNSYRFRQLDIKFILKKPTYVKV